MIKCCWVHFDLAQALLLILFPYAWGHCSLVKVVLFSETFIHTSQHLFHFVSHNYVRWIFASNGMGMHCLSQMKFTLGSRSKEQSWFHRWCQFLRMCFAHLDTLLISSILELSKKKVRKQLAPCSADWSLWCISEFIKRRIQIIKEDVPFLHTGLPYIPLPRLSHYFPLYHGGGCILTYGAILPTFNSAAPTCIHDYAPQGMWQCMIPLWISCKGQTLLPNHPTIDLSYQAI